MLFRGDGKEYTNCVAMHKLGLLQDYVVGGDECSVITSVTPGLMMMFTIYPVFNLTMKKIN
jgi:hypothetical protein